MHSIFFVPSNTCIYLHIIQNNTNTHDSVRLSMFNHVFKQSIGECKYRYFFFYPQREVSEHVHRCSFDENSYHPRNGFYDRDSSLPVQEGHRQNHRHHRSLPPRNLQSDGRRFQRGLCSGSPHYAVDDRGVYCDEWTGFTVV